MRNLTLKGLMATIATATLLMSTANAATEGVMHPEPQGYTSTGIFGKFDGHFM